MTLVLAQGALARVEIPTFNKKNHPPPTTKPDPVDFYPHLFYICVTNPHTPPYKTPMKGIHLGEFEELVLLIVAILFDQAYGVAIMHALEKHTGRPVKISAVHSALNRLEKKGYLTSWVGGATQQRGGRRKRFFEITHAGKAALLARRQMRERLWGLVPAWSLQGGAS